MSKIQAMPNERFRVTLSRRLRLTLLLTAGKCEGCGASLDVFGDHYLACMRTGRVQARAKPVERAWERALKQAGASVHFQHLLRNTTLAVDPADSRRIDLLATGLPLYRGRVLFCDATLCSPLKGNGRPQARTSRHDGATFKEAQKRKQDKTQTWTDARQPSFWS